MTTNDHPITPPPPELVGEWLCNDGYPWDPSENVTVTITTNRLRNVATQAARWGADQELEACCEWVSTVRAYWMKPETLRSARRPGLLKSQALAVLENSAVCDHLSPEHAAVLRRALEALPDD